MIGQVNEVLTAIEKTAWELRRVADDAGLSAVRAKRLGVTGWMLTQVIADYRLFGIYSAFLTRKKRAALLARIHARSAKRFYATSVQQKGAFLKVGQMLSARPDLLPAVWVKELSGLQDAAPAEPFAHVQAVVEADLGAPLHERFRSFDERPLAAASIGQVHRAVTLDGVEVAVKVQRPGIGELIDHDLALMALFLDGMAGTLPPTDYPTIVKEVQEMVRGELDYAAEAAAMTRIGALFAATPGVKVPRPLLALCGPRVLTSTYVAGERITTALDQRTPERVSSLLGTLLEVYLRQVLEAGLFQADPHPGNFLVTDADELVLLDFGCARSLSDVSRRGYLGLLQAFLGQDHARLAELFGELGFQTRSGGPETLERFAEMMLEGFRRGTWPTRDELFQRGAEALKAAERDPVTRIPADFVMLGRVFGTLGGLFMHYRPQIDYVQKILPHLAVWMSQASQAR